MMIKRSHPRSRLFQIGPIKIHHTRNSQGSAAQRIYLNHNTVASLQTALPLNSNASQADSIQSTRMLLLRKSMPHTGL